MTLFWSLFQVCRVELVDQSQGQEKSNFSFSSRARSMLDYLCIQDFWNAQCSSPRLHNNNTTVWEKKGKSVCLTGGILGHSRIEGNIVASSLDQLHLDPSSQEHNSWRTSSSEKKNTAVRYINNEKLDFVNLVGWYISFPQTVWNAKSCDKLVSSQALKVTKQADTSARQSQRPQTLGWSWPWRC